MLGCVCPPNFEEALQVRPAASAVAIHTLGCWRQNGLDLCILCQVLQSAGSNSKPAQVTGGISSPPFWSCQTLCNAGMNSVLDARGKATAMHEVAMQLLAIGPACSQSRLHRDFEILS